MHRLFPTIAFGLLLVFAGCKDSIIDPAGGEFDFTQGQTLTFESLASSFVTLEQSPVGNGRFTDRSERVIRDAADFEAFWSDLHGNLEPEPALPDVDFSSEMVIAVFLGERSNGGFSVEIERIVQQGDRIGLQVKETAPGPNCVTPAVISSPYHIIKLKQISGELAFVPERVEMQCE